MCVHINVHDCCTQHSTEQFGQFSVTSSRQSSFSSASLTSSSSTVVLHFSRLIRLTAHFSLRGLHIADWTTAVAPEPILQQHIQLSNCWVKHPYNRYISKYVPNI